MRTMLRGKVTLLFMMLGLLLAVPAIAFADVLQGDDLEAGANATKAPNDTGTAKFYLVANGSDGCNVDATHPATVTVSSDQSWLTIDSPGTAQLTACGTTNAATIGYSVSSTAPDGGVATVSGVASGGKSGNNGYNNNPGKFTVTVAVPTPSDTTPPDISYVLNPASPNGNNGWYNSGNVSLTWTVTENESAASLVKTGCVDQNITADQAATTYSCSATSDGGSAG